MSLLGERWPVLSISILFCLLCGCSHTTRGTSLKGEKIAFIHDGTTTRSEVIYNLGQPLYDFGPERTIGYLWETVSPDIPSNIAASYIDENHETIYNDPELWILFISFDKGNKVTRHGKGHMRDTDSSQKALSRWLKTK